MKNKIKQIIEKYSKNDRIECNSETAQKEDLGISFNEGDLFYSVHVADIIVNGEKNDEDNWNLNIEIEDDYDFTEILLDDRITKEKQNYLGLGSVLNDMAAISS